MNFEYPEGATPIDPDEAQGLLLSHISRRSDLDRWEHENILDALKWLERRRAPDILNESFIRELHKRMFGPVGRWAGTYRRSDKNIGKSWMQIPVAVKNLCEDTKLWIESKDESADDIGIRFHHRLVCIHPFVNGNGRHARLMTDLLLDSMKEPRFTWGGDNLSDTGETRRRYIEALREADKGKFGPLREFVRS